MLSMFLEYYAAPKPPLTVQLLIFKSLVAVVGGRPPPTSTVKCIKSLLCLRLSESESASEAFLSLTRDSPSDEPAVIVLPKPRFLVRGTFAILCFNFFLCVAAAARLVFHLGATAYTCSYRVTTCLCRVVLAL